MKTYRFIQIDWDQMSGMTEILINTMENDEEVFSCSVAPDGVVLLLVRELYV